MAITGVKAVESWGTLVELDDEGRQARLLEHYAELGGLPDDELRDRVLGIVAAECDLTDDELRAVTVSRLRVWLRLAPELVERICSTYESAVARMSADKAMRWAGILQNLRKEFSREERLRLVAIVPSAFGGVQEVDLGAFTYDEPASQKDVGIAEEAVVAFRRELGPLGLAELDPQCRAPGPAPGSRLSYRSPVQTGL